MADIINDDSILASVKKTMPGSVLPQDYEVFDQELIVHINAVLARLQQLGVGPLDEVFAISGYEEKWSDIVDDQELCSLMPTYVAMRVRLGWDTPKSSNVSQSLTEIIKENEFAIMDAARRYRRRKEDADG